MTFQGTMTFLGGIAILIAPGPFILRSKGVITVHRLDLRL